MVPGLGSYYSPFTEGMVPGCHTFWCQFKFTVWLVEKWFPPLGDGECEPLAISPVGGVFSWRWVFAVTLPWKAVKKKSGKGITLESCQEKIREGNYWNVKMNSLLILGTTGLDLNQNFVATLNKRSKFVSDQNWWLRHQWKNELFLDFTWPGFIKINMWSKVQHNITRTMLLDMIHWWSSTLTPWILWITWS